MAVNGQALNILAVITAIIIVLFVVLYFYLNFKAPEDETSSNGVDDVRENPYATGFFVGIMLFVYLILQFALSLTQNPVIRTQLSGLSLVIIGPVLYWSIRTFIDSDKTTFPYNSHRPAIMMYLAWIFAFIGIVVNFCVFFSPGKVVTVKS